MRILFLHHFPLGQSPWGRFLTCWHAALTAAGHEVQWLVAAGQPATEPAIHTVVCRAGDAEADLDFDPPRFGAPGDVGGCCFAGLTDAQLASYRDCLRRRLDQLIANFDPHLIHPQHIWVLGQLALESGVPYLLNAWGEELADYAADPRYQALADQAAENASRILVSNEALAREVVTLFPSTAGCTLIMPAELSQVDAAIPGEGQAKIADALLTIYRGVLEDRFGANFNREPA